MMRARTVVGVALAALVTAGCAGSELRARKDDAWSHVPQALSDSYTMDNPSLKGMSKLPDPGWVGYEPTMGGYGHPFRGLAFVMHPFGVALDYALVRPLYMLGGLAPEWFGLTAEDGQRYQSHFPDLVIPRDAPRRFE